ncbi:MAG: DUF5713 family protein [Candidatus Thiodiazotropha sp.]|jgi:hypothetical protein
MASINSQEILNHEFLHGMYKDGYFPDFLVDKIKNILLEVPKPSPFALGAEFKTVGRC